MGETPAATTRDAFLGGRLILEQPARGHRSGTDAVLLAAAVPPDLAGRIYDIGAGVGAVGLAIALGSPTASVTLVENDPFAVDLARRNVTANGLDGRAAVVACDVLCRDALRGQLAAAADVVVTNPPFYRPERTRPSPDAARRAAHMLASPDGFGDWLAACLSLLAPKGTFATILPAGEVPHVLPALVPRLGDLTLLAVHPRQGEAAVRVLLRGRAGSRAPFRIAPPLVLHDGDRFSEAASRLATGEDRLSW